MTLSACKRMTLQLFLKRVLWKGRPPLPTSISTIHLPTELWVEIISHLQHDRRALCRLSLVSQQLKAIVQPVLFHRVHTLYLRQYSRYLRKRHRHVLTYVHELTLYATGLVPPPRMDPWPTDRGLNLLMFLRPPHPVTFLPYMTNLTRLFMHVQTEANHKKIRHILQRCIMMDTFDLEEIFVRHTCFTIKDKSMFTALISKQKHLKRLTIILNQPVYLDFHPETLPGLEFVEASWKQICILLPGRNRISALHVRGSYGPFRWGQVGSEAELKTQLARVRSLVIPAEIFKNLQLVGILKGTQYLWLLHETDSNPDLVDDYISPLTELKVVVRSIQIWDPLRRLDLARSLMGKVPSLEAVVFCSHEPSFPEIMEAWIRGDDAKTYAEAAEEFSQLISMCRDSKRLYCSDI